jgi:hypothetical protein
LTFSLAICGGCGDAAPNLVAVSGSITLDGQPLSGAIVTFEPLPGTPGPKASALVVDGNYRIEPAAQLQPGSFRVRVAMLPAEMLKAVAPQAVGRVVSPQFDADSKLSAQLEATAQNHADFAVAESPRRNSS